MLEVAGMFDHVMIRVADRSISERFFATVLAPLGIDATRRTDSLVVWHEFMLSEADEQRPTTTGLHIAFVAPSRGHVADFWQAGIDAGHPDDGPPGPRPQHGEHYYAAYLRDPSGNSVEAVHAGAPRRDGGVVDHVTLRVSDLAASSAFYRTIAGSLGINLLEEQPERTTFAAAGSGGTFSLVPGDPTANLHLAFPGGDDSVQRFHADAVAAGYRSNGEPGERPRYHPGYYAAFVLDPDGNNIEVVNHHRS
jgi:catechol 2,3-dioxygenase-like lactoylglutathione lyase family enzyme